MPVSDSARHAGGVLLNNLGERFMTRYDPERMELSAQETVTRASCTEIQEGRGSRSGGVWMDLSHLPGDTVLARLPHLHRTLLELQMLDITRDPGSVRENGSRLSTSSEGALLAARPMFTSSGGTRRE